MTYKDALNHIFASYLSVKPLLKGKLDRETRKPEIILKLARTLDLLPNAQKTLKITGSKGKGTVARLSANALESQGKVGLLISPEEIDHTDRMRINGVAISKERFVACYEKLLPHLKQPQKPDYLSPYGLFLLIALQWFKEEGVEFFVIETGRGVRFDEGGQLPAHVGVVTSIFKEHADYLGPSLEEIKVDKLSITQSCTHLVLGNTDEANNSLRPHWFAQCQETAHEALTVFLGQSLPVPACPVASFGQKGKWYYEGMIACESADQVFLERLIKQHQGHLRFILSLPDDKDIEGICELLAGLNATMEHVILTGERGFLSYEKARLHTVCYEGPFDDVSALQKALKLDETQASYFIGTQTFLRLIKQAYFL
ncbi:putative FolC bifunctional protein [Candidatus Terasakiella magnetica]|uniref:Putative FolC bifunctional protein n=1 Tax=Candidatus Terasakiella magnetica TaxID=1867952 RepID=A0A1C3RII6_9PROT|nr:Mur ligase family protein [Candidatus Terasakiella magnetica]SCA57090.1 putative FolC bifunctional protein [Candidatus Terasakiella magnetica]